MDRTLRDSFAELRVLAVRSKGTSVQLQLFSIRVRARSVESDSPADKKQLVSEVVLCLCGLGDQKDEDSIEAAGKLIENIAADRRTALTKELARWIVEPCATAI